MAPDSVADWFRWTNKGPNQRFADFIDALAAARDWQRLTEPKYTNFYDHDGDDFIIFQVDVHGPDGTLMSDLRVDYDGERAFAARVCAHCVDMGSLAEWVDSGESEGLHLDEGGAPIELVPATPEVVAVWFERELLAVRRSVH